MSLNKKDIEVSDQFFFDAIKKSDCFEELCGLMVQIASGLSLSEQEVLYKSMSQDKDLIRSIAKFSDHEEFHTAIWSVVYQNKSDLNLLEQCDRLSNRIVPLPHNVSLAICSNNYPVVQDLSALPMVIK